MTNGSNDTPNSSRSSSRAESEDSEGSGSVERRRVGPAVTNPQCSTMPSPTEQLPLFWKEGIGNQYTKLLKAGGFGSQVVSLALVETERCEPDGIPVMRCRKVAIDTSGPSSTPRGLENLDLHSLVDLHNRLEEERDAMPGELVVRGRVSGHVDRYRGVCIRNID